MTKIHIGLVSENKNFENLIKESAQQMGGAYLHHSKTIYELIQKLALQKIQMIMVVLPGSGDGSDFSATYSFIRSKKDLQKLPVCVLTETERFEVPFLLMDPSVRAFPLAGGLFLPVLSMTPLVEGHAPAEGVLTKEWIQQEFHQSLSAKVGQRIAFKIREATEDERRSSFFSQTSQEVRSHLGWFKFTIRLLETSSGTSQLFEGMDRDTIETVSETLLKKITEDFEEKVRKDLSTRGAIYLPEVDRLPQADKKKVYSQTKYSGVLFEADQCQFLLEIGQCLPS